MSDLIRERYRPLELLGEGPHGRVVRAADTQLGREVAIKIRPVSDQPAREALLRRARALAAAKPHPGTPHVREDFFLDGRYHLVLDWVEGRTLRSVLDERGNPGLPPEEALRYLHQAADALDHLRGAVPPAAHGDVRLDNLVLTDSGSVVLVGMSLPESAGAGPGADMRGLAASARELLCGGARGAAAWPGLTRAEALVMEEAMARAEGREGTVPFGSAAEFVAALRTRLVGSLPAGTLTFLLTDVESSTRLWELYPEAMAVAMRRHDEILARAIERTRGRLPRDQGEGDSLLAVFASATDAMACAIDMQRDLAAERWPDATPLRVRIALHTGEAELRDGNYHGTAVNRAARLRSIAFGGQTLVGGSTALLLTGALPKGAVLVDLGPRALKDLKRPEHVYELRLEEPGGSPEPVDDRGASSLAWLETGREEPFVDRVSEMGALEAAWSRGASGRRVLALLAGDPGIGKTTLAGRLARRAAAAGALVLYGRHDEDVLAPYQAFRQALGEYARECPRSILRADVRDIVGEISRLFPDVAQRVGAVEAPLPGDAEAERFRLFEALDAWIVALASRGPVLLVLDDLQWADRPSLLLIRHLMRSPRTTPLMVLATHRDTDLDRTELGAFLPTLTRGADTERVSVRGLDDPYVLELVAGETALAGQRQVHASDPLVRQLQEETAGNPFFLREFMRHLADEGAVPRLAGSSTTEGLGLPESVRDVVQWRLGRLAAECVSVLGAASVIGMEFALELLATVTGTEVDPLLDLLEPPRRAGLIGDVPEADGRYAFSHAVVRRVLLDGLGGPRRARLHRRVGETLEALGGPMASVAELAHHYSEAAATGVAEKAIRYTRLAGDDALEQVAYESAVQHYRRALEVLNAYGPQDETLRCELLLALGNANDRAGEYPARDEHYIEAAAVARDLDRGDLFTRAALGYGGVLPAAVAPDPRARMLLEEAMERLPEGDGADRARVLGRLAHWLHYERPYETRRSISDQAVAMATRVGDQDTLATVLFHRCWALDGPDDVADQLALAGDVLRLGEERRDYEMSLQGLRVRLAALFEQGDVEAARDTAAVLGRLAGEIRHPEYVRLASMWEVAVAAWEGRFADAERLAAELHARLQQIGHAQAQLILLGQTFAWRWLQGRAGEYLPIFEAMRAHDPDTLAWSAATAWCCAETGLAERAREIMAALTPASAGSVDRNYLWWPTVVGFASAAVSTGDRAWAEVLYDLILPYSEHNCTVGLTSFIGAVAHHLGLLAGVLGRWDVAARHHEFALRRHRAMRARPFVALTELAYAEALDRGEQGDRREAQAMRESAARTARDLGLGAVEQRDGHPA